MTTSHLQGSQITRTKDGAFFAAGADGIWRSADGQVSTWTLVPDTGPIVGGLVTDGSTMFASTCYFGDFCNPRYLHSLETDGQTWTAMPEPDPLAGRQPRLRQGPRLLYRPNLDAGLWRVVAD